MANTNPFQIEHSKANPQHLDVHVDKLATIQIKRDEEGVVVDIYPYKDLSAAPAASTCAHAHDLDKDARPSLPLLTAWQQIALKSYDGGEFSYICDATDGCALHQDVRDCGDSLLRFIVSELSAKEDCASTEQAIRRLEIARDQLNDLLSAFIDAQTETSEKAVVS